MKKAFSIIIAAAMLFSIMVPAFAASPLKSSNVSVHFESDNTSVNPSDSVALTLIVEGLGANPNDNQINSIAFSSSDNSVAEVGSYSTDSYTPAESSEATGLACELTVSANSTGISKITADVTDVSGNTYTCSCFVTVRGIIVQQKNITLEVGESCLVFAERYGFTESQSTKNLSWIKNGDNTGWISMGIHGSGRQNEAYYIKGISEGTGTVTVSLSGSGFSDTINVTVVPKNSVTIEQDGAEVTSTVDLSSTASVTLDAVCEGFVNPTITWESSHPDLVSVSQSGDSALISRVAYSDTVAAVKVTATEGDISRTKTVYVSIAGQYDASLKIAGTKLVNNSVTIKQGETLTLSAETLSLDSAATLWSAATDGGRVPVKLSGTVGKNITITGRLVTSSPVAVTATNGGTSDTVYVSVAPNEEKSVKITCPILREDGVMTLEPTDTETVSVELNGFSANPTVTWKASIAKNSENSNGTGTCPVMIDNTAGMSTVVTAQTASLDFAKITVSVNDEGTVYTDEIYVKVTDRDIINSKYVSIFKNDAITLSTINGESASWYSNSQKTYFGSVSKKPTTDTGETAVIRASSSTTLNPSRITAQQDGYTDSVYVMVAAGSWKTVSFNLNGGYGETPKIVTMSTNDTYQSIILPTPEAAYPSDNGEYVFYGWSENANAAQPNSTALIYYAGEEYSVPSDRNSINLYAVWVKKAQDALFSIRLTGDIAPEPSGQSISDYGRSCIYIEDVLEPEGFYYNVNGVESHLAKLPSDTDIARALSMDYKNGSPLSYNPDTDRVIWYVIKRNPNDAAGLPNWHIDGILVKNARFSITYNKNITVANVSGFPNPPRIFYDENTSASIISNVPACNGTEFIGWNTRPDGRGQWYTSTGSLYNGHTTTETVETSILLTEDIVLYAIWDGRLCYDINEDGVEDVNDIGFVMSASAGLIDSTDRRLSRADLNGDGAVDGFDAAWLDRLFYSLGILIPVIELPQISITEIAPVTVGEITPDFAIDIATEQTPDEIAGKDYADWDIDFVLTFNQAVNKDDIYIFGQYGTLDWKGGRLANNGTLAAEEKFSVIHTWLPSIIGMESYALNYTDIVELVKDFKCSIHANNPADGLKATVQLVATEPNGTVHVLDTYTCSF